MSREQETEVLVVGAGPVGMLTALLLSENGIRVRIIDKEERTAAHSYACALHPRTLKLLDRLALCSDLMAVGRRIETVAFYEGEFRRAEMNLSRLPVDFPYLVILPQSALENLLEQRLRRDKGVKVEWSHRLSNVDPQSQAVVAGIDKLCETSKGYIIRELDWEVQKTLRCRAQFVVGTDGYDSFVRNSLGIEHESVSEPDTFAVYEFETDGQYPNEARIVMDDATINGFWPVTDHKCRWTLQVADGDDLEESHMKERSDVVVVDQAVDVSTLQHVRQKIQERAPWFSGSVKQLDWSVDVQFEARFAKHFGQGRCWLAGDAAHQTAPFGMQSLNVGLLEAEQLAGTLTKILRQNGSMDLLEAYDRSRRNEWQHLLGVKGGLRPRNGVAPWVKERSSRILPCVPGSGEDLARLVNQLGLDFHTGE